MQQQTSTTVPTLRHWLIQQTATERTMIMRLWALGAVVEQSPEVLADTMLSRERVADMYLALEPEVRAALVMVQQRGGRIPAAVLERESGPIRVSAQYSNPRAYLMALEQPPTITERLYARGLILPWQEGAQRFYIVPSDLLSLLPPPPQPDRSLILQSVTAPSEIVVGAYHTLERNLLTLLLLAYDDQLELTPAGGLNKASLLRLAKRWSSQADLRGITREEHWPYVSFLRQTGMGAGLLRSGLEARLSPAHAALDWMQRSTIDRAMLLLQGWISGSWDELVHLMGMRLQRAYSRDLAGAKRAVLNLLAQVPTGQWVLLDEFVAQVRRVAPDFARPDGRYDTWGLLDYYRRPCDGFSFWEQVEGEQLRSMVGGSLCWIGLIDLGMQGETPISFRVTTLGATLLRGELAPPEPAIEPLVVQPNFEVIVPPGASLLARFQLARIAELAISDRAEIYKLTKRSIQAALDRSISLERIIQCLHEQSGRVVPQNIQATLRDWAAQHGQLSLQRAVLLEADDPLVLEQIRRDKRLRLPKVDVLTERAWIIPEGDAALLAERLRKAGYGLTSPDLKSEAPLTEHDLTVLFAALHFYGAAGALLEAEHDLSGALTRRVARLLPERQINRAYQSSQDLIRRLKERLMS